MILTRFNYKYAASEKHRENWFLELLLQLPASDVKNADKLCGVVEFALQLNLINSFGFQRQGTDWNTHLAPFLIPSLHKLLSRNLLRLSFALLVSSEI